MRRLSLSIIVFAFATGLAIAQAFPPNVMNYQGVLRNASDEPIDGTVSMTLRLWTSAVGGDEILVDAHSAVTVSRGLFTVQIGGGVIADGSGPGVYAYLPAVFRDHRDVYLEVQVNGEVLSPRTRIVSSAYALNARYVNGVEVAGASALDLYVNAATGSDDYSGLSAATPKRTIQAAIDRIPVIIRGDVTVWIAAGTYEEAVTIADRSAPGGHRIRLSGNNRDTTRISGSGLRGVVLSVARCAGVDLEGLSFENAAGTEGPSGDGIQFWNANGSIINCRASSNAHAGLSAYQSFVQVENTEFASNRFGVAAVFSAPVLLNNVSVTASTHRGLYAEFGSVIQAAGPVTVTASANEGCYGESGGVIDLGDRSDIVIQGNNTGGCQMAARLHGIVLGYENAILDSPACCEVASGTCQPGPY